MYNKKKLHDDTSKVTPPEVKKSMSGDKIYLLDL